jgi:integrase
MSLSADSDQAVLEAAPKHDAITLCANSEGKPGTESGFRASWRTYRTRLRNGGAIGPGLTLYGLRHTVAVILRECGFDERTIADALGQAPSRWRATTQRAPTSPSRCVMSPKNSSAK